MPRAVSDTGFAGRTLLLATVVAGLASALSLASVADPATHVAAPPTGGLALSIERGETVPIRRAPAGGILAIAGWQTPFGSVRRLRVVEHRGDWFAVESDVLGNGVVGWVPRTAPVRRQWIHFSVEADLSDRLVTLRVDGEVVLRRRVSIGASDSPTPSGRFHVTDHSPGGNGASAAASLLFRVHSRSSRPAGPGETGSRSTGGRSETRRSVRRRAPGAST
jgi:L,D-transpeptidase catalytic domain